MTKLTPALKRQITEDWHKLFPQLAVYKSMWLARRVGPLVHGICLDRDTLGTAYFPTTHLHNLCRPDLAVSLSLGQRLLDKRSGTQERIAVQFHEKNYREAARQLAEASLLPLVGDLTLRQVLDAFHAYRKLNNPDSKYPVSLFKDGILLTAWAGRYNEALDLLNEFAREMQTWPGHVMAYGGGLDTWKKKMLESIANPENLKVTAEAQAHELKVNDLPSDRLVD